jgi:hypothetical protein
MGLRKKCRRSGKRKFSTHERALFRAGQILEKPGAPKELRAYRCRFCNHWHLTKS